MAKVLLKQVMKLEQLARKKQSKIPVWVMVTYYDHERKWLAKEIFENGNWRLVEVDGVDGYIPPKDFCGTLIIDDLSDSPPKMGDAGQKELCAVEDMAEGIIIHNRKIGERG